MMMPIYDPTPRVRPRRQTYRPRRDLIVFPVGMKRMSAFHFAVLVMWAAIWLTLVVAAASTLLLGAR